MSLPEKQAAENCRKGLEEGIKNGWLLSPACHKCPSEQRKYCGEQE